MHFRWGWLAAGLRPGQGRVCPACPKPAFWLPRSISRVQDDLAVGSISAHVGHRLLIDGHLRLSFVAVRYSTKGTNVFPRWGVYLKLVPPAVVAVTHAQSRKASPIAPELGLLFVSSKRALRCRIGTKAVVSACESRWPAAGLAERPRPHLKSLLKPGPSFRIVARPRSGAV